MNGAMKPSQEPLKEAEARRLIYGELQDRDIGEDRYLAEHLRRYVETINFMIPVTPGSKVLDIGIFDGALDLLMKEHFSVSVSGIDLRTPDNARWTERFSRLGIDFKFCDLLREKIPYPDGTFDLATMCEVVEHLPALPNEILNEVRRVMKEGGTFILTSSNIASLYRRLRLLFGKSPISFFRDYTPEELVYMLESAGFEVLSATFRDYRNNTNAIGPNSKSSLFDSIVKSIYSLVVRPYPRLGNSVMIKAIARPYHGEKHDR